MTEPQKPRRTPNRSAKADALRQYAADYQAGRTDDNAWTNLRKPGDGKRGDPAHTYRLAQANRFIRLATSHGVDPAEAMAGRVELDVSPICDADGKIVPEQVDFDEVRNA
jgi:hypothetical protein